MKKTKPRLYLRALCTTRNAGIWARLLMASVAMIYFARLSLAALGHRRTRPREFEQYSMPEWWGVYRHLGAGYRAHSFGIERDCS